MHAIALVSILEQLPLHKQALAALKQNGTPI